MGPIEYRVVSPDEVDVGELLEFYRRQRHEITGSADKLRRMVALSDCVVLARDEGRLIGIARGVADGVRGYLSECKLDLDYQGPAAVTRTDGRVEHDEHGIAREMAARVLDSLRELGVESVHVIAHGTEEDFCVELGFRRARGAVAMQMDLTSPAGLRADDLVRLAGSVQAFSGHMGGGAAQALTEQPLASTGGVKQSR